MSDQTTLSPLEHAYQLTPENIPLLFLLCDELLRNEKGEQAKPILKRRLHKRYLQPTTLKKSY
ncbi:MAG: hypothetical protein COB66_05990 [Coxiella sp. (in: Bacteria)]|nr:MAG: hypothetical protein COB66_05990 [Coxiella sp. (in: g-proteobacteria)]